MAPATGPFFYWGAAGLLVATANADQFKRVKGLKVANWLG